VAALVWSAYPSLTNADIRAALDATAKDLGDPGRDPAYGYGLVQAYDALQYLAGSGGGGDTGGTLNVTVTTDKSIYTNRETVTITVTVTDDTGAAVEGATVDITITTANGNQWAGSGTTDANGQAVFTYRVNANRDGNQGRVSYPKITTEPCWKSTGRCSRKRVSRA